MQPVQRNSPVKRRVVSSVVGGVYQLIPSMGGQYIQIIRKDRRYVYAVGYGPHTADIKVRIRRWPEIVIKRVDIGDVVQGALLLSGEPGYVILLSNGRILLTTEETDG